MKLNYKAKLTVVGAIAVLLITSVRADNDPRVFSVNCDTQPNKLQKALHKANPGDTILVSGTCQENVVIPAELHRITLDGQGTATVNGPDATTGTFEITGTDIVIKGFTITGGLFGVHVTEGGSATIDANTIQQTGRDGIQINKNSTAMIVNNKVQNNPEDGIRVGESSSARIGFRGVREIRNAEPNVIQNNGGRGIRVNRSSSARIYSNTISSNGNHGIDVARAAYADISSNNIDGNAGDGILVVQNSAVVLGADVTEDPVADDPNSTTVPNARAGIRCGTNSSVDGRRGTLTGVLGPLNFDSSCTNSTIP